MKYINKYITTEEWENNKNGLYELPYFIVWNNDTQKHHVKYISDISYLTNVLIINDLMQEGGNKLYLYGNNVSYQNNTLKIE